MKLLKGDHEILKKSQSLQTEIKESNGDASSENLIKMTKELFSNIKLLAKKTGLKDESNTISKIITSSKSRE